MRAKRVLSLVTVLQLEGRALWFSGAKMTCFCSPLLEHLLWAFLCSACAGRSEFVILRCGCVLLYRLKVTDSVGDRPMLPALTEGVSEPHFPGCVTPYLGQFT